MYLIATVCGTAPTLRCVISAFDMLIAAVARLLHDLISLFYVWCVRLLFVIAVHHPVRTNWTPARTMMLYWHTSLQQPAASIAIPSA